MFFRRNCSISARERTTHGTEDCGANDLSLEASRSAPSVTAHILGSAIASPRNAHKMAAIMVIGRQNVRLTTSARARAPARKRERERTLNWFFRPGELGTGTCKRTSTFTLRFGIRQLCRSILSALSELLNMCLETVNFTFSFSLVKTPRIVAAMTLRELDWRHVVPIQTHHTAGPREQP